MSEREPRGAEVHAPRWVKSTFSGGTEACIEFARVGDSVLLRNSRHVDLVLDCTLDEVRAFLAGAKDGQFDALLADPGDLPAQT